MGCILESQLLSKKEIKSKFSAVSDHLLEKEKHKNFIRVERNYHNYYTIIIR